MHEILIHFGSISSWRMVFYCLYGSKTNLACRKKKKEKSFVALGLGTVFELHKNRRRLAFHNPYGSKLKFGYYLTKWQVNQWSLEGILGINLINKVVDLALSLPSNGALKWLNLCVAFQDSYMLKALVHGFNEPTS